MPAHPENVRRSAHARDAAVLRLRRVTQLSVAFMIAVGGAFAALAAGSTHAKKTVVVVRAAARQVSSTAVLVQAPAPPLVGVDGGQTSDSQAAAPTAAPAAPAAAPAYQQPVVVSGGS